MTNGQDDAQPTATAGHATTEQLALAALVTAAEDMGSWAVLAETILRQVEDSLSAQLEHAVDDDDDDSCTVEDEDNRDCLRAPQETLEGQRTRLGQALRVVLQAHEGAHHAEAVQP